MADAAAMPLILASGSCARRQMLEAAGIVFSVVPADLDERAIRQRLQAGKAAGAAEIAVALARVKAKAVSRAHPAALVIGADQILALGGEIFEKPADLAGAREHLLRLRGRSHHLHCGVALAQDGSAVWSHTDSAGLVMRAFGDDFLEQYLARAGRAVCDSVGAYQLEGLGIQLFERIDGDFFTILGMPLLPLLAELRRRRVVAA